MGFEDVDKRFRSPAQLACLRCGNTNGVELEDSRTAYPDDPNSPIPLCRPCAEFHHGYWDGMWADYYSGLL